MISWMKYFQYTERGNTYNFKIVIVIVADTTEEVSYDMTCHKGK